MVASGFKTYSFFLFLNVRTNRIFEPWCWFVYFSFYKNSVSGLIKNFKVGVYASKVHV